MLTISLRALISMIHRKNYIQESILHYYYLRDFSYFGFSFFFFKNTLTLLCFSKKKIKGQSGKNKTLTLKYCLKNKATLLFIFKLFYPLINSKCVILAAGCISNLWRRSCTRNFHPKKGLRLLLSMARSFFPNPLLLLKYGWLTLPNSSG